MKVDLIGPRDNVMAALRKEQASGLRDHVLAVLGAMPAGGYRVQVVQPHSGPGRFRSGVQIDPVDLSLLKSNTGPAY